MTSTPARWSKVAAATVASGAFVVPLALSASSSPSPNHPRIFIWYRLLRKPGFKPADWVIPATWLAIEAGLSATAYRLLRAAPGPARSTALTWLAGNVLAIGGWSQLFFKRQQLGVSTVAAGALALSSKKLIDSAGKVDPIAARAAVPLLLWVSFATVLTGTIWHLNRKR
jgi:benzodiazapine receptor